MANPEAIGSSTRADRKIRPPMTQSNYVPPRPARSDLFSSMFSLSAILIGPLPSGMSIVRVTCKSWPAQCFLALAQKRTRRHLLLLSTSSAPLETCSLALREAQEVARVCKWCQRAQHSCQSGPFHTGEAYKWLASGEASRGAPSKIGS